MALLPEQQLIASVVGYTPVNEQEGSAPADTSCCVYEVEEKDGWPHIFWRKNWYAVPTVEDVEEWVFDSVCPTPDEDEVEPDHPRSWLSILGLI